MKPTLSAEVAALKLEIAALKQRIEDLERINFHAEWNNQARLLIKKEKA